MKVLIIDKDGVLNPEAFTSSVKWGFLNLSPIIMGRILYGYLVLGKFADADMNHLEKFFAEEADKLAPSPENIAAMGKLRQEYDYIIMLTNNGHGDAAQSRVTNEINKFYPVGTFDEIIIQPVGHEKKSVYKKWIDAGHDVTIIDDSKTHVAAALGVGASRVVAIGNKTTKGALTAKSLADYTNIKKLGNNI